MIFFWAKEGLLTKIKRLKAECWLIWVSLGWKYDGGELEKKQRTGSTSRPFFIQYPMKNHRY